MTLNRVVVFWFGNRVRYAFCCILAYNLTGIVKNGVRFVDEQSILQLAVISLGIFVGVLLSTIIYVASVRSTLLGTDDDPLQEAIHNQRQVVRDLQRELQQQTKRWSDHLVAMEEQQETQKVITTGLLNLQPEKFTSATPSVPIDEFQNLLTEHRTLLDSLQHVVSDNQQAFSNQRRTFTRHLKQNQAILQRLTTLVQNQPVGEAASPQLGEVMLQIDELAKLVQKVGQQRPALPTKQDRLADIKGIGPVFSGIFHEAGIHTFEQLAKMTPAELDILLNLPKWRKVNTAEWIEQARLFATQRRKVENPE